MVIVGEANRRLTRAKAAPDPDRLRSRPRERIGCCRERILFVLLFPEIELRFPVAARVGETPCGLLGS